MRARTLRRAAEREERRAEKNAARVSVSASATAKRVSGVPAAPAELPDDPAVLKRMIAELIAELSHERQNGELLRQEVDALLHRLYGRSSEKLDPAQLALFAALAVEPASEPVRESETPTSQTRRRNHRGRRPLPAHLPRKRIVHELPEAERLCPCCKEPMERIREETSEQLEYEPASVHVIEHVCPVYACPKKCDEAIVTAPRPPQPIDKGLCGPGLLAHVVVSKCGDHLPFHRQEEILGRLGVELSRQTLCGWAAAAAQLASPVYGLVKTWILEGSELGTDDTPVTVLEPGGPGRHTGRVWVYVGDRDHPAIVYDYTPDRSRDGPAAFLGDWKGHLQADAYSGYDGIFAKGTVVELACWMHARRYFREAMGSEPARAAEMLALIAELYRVEAECRDFEPDARGAHRQAHATPVLDRIEGRLEHHRLAVPPRSKIGEAIEYARNQWAALRRYTENGRFEIDNGRSERALRGIAVGRNNWLFAGSDGGGRTAAILFTLIRTAKLHGVDPEAYLRDLFRRLPTLPADRLHKLTPMAWAKDARPAVETPPS